jgi:heat shock protein HslJ
VLLLLGVHGCTPKEPYRKQEEAPAQTAAMPSGSWQTVAIRGKSIKGPPPTFALDTTQNSVAGFGGCNRFFGSFSLNGKNIKFSQLGSTKMFCYSVDFEEDFFAALDRADHYGLVNDVLTFYDKDNNKLLESIKTAD